jgi:hypothetical protein
MGLYECRGQDAHHFQVQVQQSNSFLGHFFEDGRRETRPVTERRLRLAVDVPRSSQFAPRLFFGGRGRLTGCVEVAKDKKKGVGLEAVSCRLGFRLHLEHHSVCGLGALPLHRHLGVGGCARVPQFMATTPQTIKQFGRVLPPTPAQLDGLARHFCGSDSTKKTSGPSERNF